MKSEFTAGFFRGNREKLRALFTGTAPIVLTGNGLLERGTRETYPFKQDGDFWYLTGIDVPNMVLVMDKNKEYLIAPQLSHYQKVFDGEVSAKELAARSGIEVILPAKEGWKQLETRLKRVKHVATLAAPPAFIDLFGMYTAPARAALILRLREINSHLELLDLNQHMQRMRMVKQAVEVGMIKQAIAATISGVEYVEKKYLAAQYAHEFEVELDLSRQFWKLGASAHSFDAVVAGGEKGLTLHVAEKGELDPDKQLLVDVGAEYQHYAADISRTWMREPTKRFTLVRDTVGEVADFAMDLLKPGVLIKDYEKQIEAFMGEKLRELGLIKIIEHDTVRHYFPHATSHFLGIDVHDVGDYDRPLEANVVLTVEPGIYIPEEGIGVRIEDDILITAKGCINLSEALAR